MKFLKKIFSYLFLFISIFLLFFTYYKSEIYWVGTKNDYYLIYYILSILIFFFSIITFFINQRIKEYLIIFVMSITFSLYIFEGYSQFKKKITKEQIIYEKKTGKKYDMRTRIKVYQDLQKDDKKISITVTPRKFLKENYPVLPFSGISNSKTIGCNENGYYSIYQSDRYGFNNPDKEWDSKEIEFLLVGDSFVYGDCVDRPNDITSVLRSLSNKSALNLGNRGNGPLVEYAILREYLNSNVKKILWIYYEGNDPDDLKNELQSKILNRYLKDHSFTQNLILRQNEINQIINKVIKNEEKKEKEKKVFRIKFINFLKLNNTRTQLNTLLPGKLQPYDVTQKLNSQEFEKILKSTKNLAVENNSKLYFVYLPSYHRYKIDFDNKDYNLIKRIINNLAIPFIDIHTEVFEKENNPLNLFPFKLYGHYTVEGYKKIAETIYDNIKD